MRLACTPSSPTAAPTTTTATTIPDSTTTTVTGPAPTTVADPPTTSAVTAATTTTRPPATSTTTRPAPASFNAGNVPVGYYQCYRSFASSGSTTGYDTTSPGSFTLSSDGTYKESLKGATGHWSSSGDAITFVAGGFDDTTGEHDQGVYVAGGATLPHNQINDGSVLSIVIQGSPGNNDAEPPATETDATGTFWYCKLRP